MGVFPRSVSRSRLIRWLAFPALSVLLLFLALHSVQWAEVRAAIRGANFAYLLLASALMLSFYFLEAVRWSCMLRWRVPITAAFRYSRTAYLVTTALPLQLGEGVKPTFLRVKHNIPYAEGLTSVMAGRLLDVATMTALGLVAAAVLSFSHKLEAWFISVLRLSALVTFVLLGGLAVTVARPGLIKRLADAILARLPLPFGIKTILQRILALTLEGVAFAREPRYSVPTVFGSPGEK